MKINVFLDATNAVNGGYQVVRPKIECNDGFCISVQAGYGTYCHPRVSGLHHYEELELGYPNEKDDLILEYAEDEGSPKNTVYGYVPVEIVDEMIEKHGGMNEQVMSKRVDDFWKKLMTKNLAHSGIKEA